MINITNKALPNTTPAKSNRTICKKTVAATPSFLMGYKKAKIISKVISIRQVCAYHKIPADALLGSRMMCKKVAGFNTPSNK
jgi:hypothetical protein